MEKSPGATARKNLDQRLAALRDTRPSLNRPPRGWIRAIRQALGMEQVQLARRLTVSPAAVAQMEKQEEQGKIQIDTLKRAAQALDCELVYVLLPRRPLEDVVQERRSELAKKQLNTVEHTMRLENQGVEDDLSRRTHLETLMEQIKPSELWEDE